MNPPSPLFHYSNCGACGARTGAGHLCASCAYHYAHTPPKTTENPKLAHFLDDYVFPKYLKENRGLNILFCGRPRSWKTTLGVRISEMIETRNKYGIFYSVDMTQLMDMQKPNMVMIQDDLDNFISSIDQKNSENSQTLQNYFNAFSKNNNVNMSVIHFANTMLGKLKSYYDVVIIAYRRSYGFYHITRNYMSGIIGTGGKPITPLKLFSLAKSEVIFSKTELEKMKKKYGIDDATKDAQFKKEWAKRKGMDSARAEHAGIMKNYTYGD